MITRRTFLQSGASIMTLAALAPAAAASSPQIDVHHHFSPPLLREYYERANRSGRIVATPPMSWDLDLDIADMDRGGTHMALLSSFTPYDVGTATERAELARGLNEFGANVCARYPKRFALLATLPMPALDETLTEIAHAFDELHAKGVIVYSSTGDRWFSDPQFTPVHEELNRRRAVVLVHPNSANCCHNLLTGVPDNIIEYATDTTRVIAGLIFGGATTRYRDIRFIFAHGGGTMPFLIERFLGGTSAQIVPGIVTRGQAPPYTPKQPPAGALAELRRMYYDTAQCANPAALRALKTVVGPSNILFGTDYWYRSAQESRDGVVSSEVFSKSEMQAIFAGNALKLWPDLAA